MKLKKGSAAAKAYMAKIRAKRKKVTKSSVAKPKRAAKKAVKAARKKAAKKVSSIHKDTASHNVRINVMSGLKKLKYKREDKHIVRFNDMKDPNKKWLQIFWVGGDKYKINTEYYGKKISCITNNVQAIDDYKSQDGIRRISKGYKALRAEVIRKNKTL